MARSASRGAHGLFVHQTRLLSRYRWLIDGAAPLTAALSNVEQHSSLGYYICPPRTVVAGDGDDAEAVDPNEHTVELRVSRYVGGGVHEDVDVTNYSGWPVSLRLTLEVDADFAGPGELYGESGAARGRLDRRWSAAAQGDRWTLTFEYRAEHAYDRQGNQGVARIDRGLSRSRFIKRLAAPLERRSNRLRDQARAAGELACAAST